MRESSVEPQRPVPTMNRSNQVSEYDAVVGLIPSATRQSVCAIESMSIRDESGLHSCRISDVDARRPTLSITLSITPCPREAKYRMSSNTAPVDPADPRIMDGGAWNEFCDTLRRAGNLVVGEGVPASPRQRAEGFRYLTRFLSAGAISCVLHDDPDYPVLARMMDYTMPWGLDNPDCLYLYAPLRGGATYRLHGRRGTANHLDIQVNWGHFANGDISEWGTISSLDGLDLVTGQGGSFELTIGGEKTGGNWLASAGNAEFLLIRQYFEDWEREQPADMLIERIGEDYPIPPPRTDYVADRLAKLSRWLEKGGALWENMSRGFLAMEPNSLIIHMPEAAGERTGMRGQAYGMGHFACAEDEAVIVVFEPPECRHWGVALANYHWESVEFGSRQSSLNRAQARLDSDGLFRGVIAHEDPGVPNWLDPGCNTEGTITARFLHAKKAPTPSFTKLPLEQLREALPPETPIIGPRERQEYLRRRRDSVLKRYRR